MRIADLLLNTKLPLLADGAFGTYFRDIAQSNAPCEPANIEQPQLVLDIHRGYLQAGAKVLYSNTFAANFLLAEDEQALQDIISAGLSLARQAAGENAAVLGDIGPVNLRGTATEDELCGHYLRLAKLFCAGGARDFVFETMPGFAELLPALTYLRQEQPDAFVLVSFAVSQDGYSNKGLYYKDLLDAAYSSGLVNAAGLNCVCGPGHMTRLIAAYKPQGKLLAAMPNAGYPVQINQRLVYEDNVDYYGERLKELAALGCFMIGGCCGTTPAHIAKAAQLLRAAALPAVEATASSCRQMPDEDGSKQKTAAPGRGFTAVVELNPPISADVEHFMAAARLAHKAGADIISVTDSPLARVRADSLMLAAKLRRELGVEVMPHLSCRDRNRLGLQAALLGGAIEGIRYVLAVRGDAGEDAVFSLNSRELMSFIGSINRELLANAPYTYGGALNINAPNFEAELKRALGKEAAGCSFFLTQPVLDEKAIGNTARAQQTLGVPVLAGILPVAGYKNALFLQQEVAGINIPEELIADLQGANAQEARAISLAYCRRIMAKLKPCCHGFYFSTPLNKIDMVCELVAEVKQHG